jgi:phenylacetic acid degradation operon negative regulatory protein
MTVLGEFVLPRDRPVWTSVLVDVLGMLDVEEKSARQALARSSAEGWVVSARVGRRVRWSLTPPGRRLRTRLTWAGFGSPVSGVWVSPDVTRQGEAQKIVSELGLDSQAMSFTSHYGEVGEQESMVARSWDLTNLKNRYEGFIDSFTGLNPIPGESVLRAQTQLVHEWRRFPFLDPQLPLELLPANWSGSKAAELFHHTHVEWRPGAQEHWDSLVDREERS